MNCRSFLAHCGLASLAALVAVPAAFAQSSSSSSFTSQAEFRTQSGSQYPTSGGGYGQGGYKQYPTYGVRDYHKLAIEAGAGFNAPVGNTQKTQTFGWNFTGGAGYNMSKHFGILAEYQFARTGIPNSVLASQSAPQGNVHIWSLTLDPILYYKTSGAIGGYITGGGGFYRKLTSFTQPVYEGIVCDFYGYCYPQYGTVTLSHFSSNQGGVNIGTGITHRISDTGTMIFAEARYLWVDSPRNSPTQIGSGTVSMIPVSFGIRW